MMHTDPIADMLTRIRNGARARKARVDVPYSALKVQLAEILKREGFVGDYREIAGATPGQGSIEIKLRYDDANEPVIQNLKRLSRPGLRRYLRHKSIPRIRAGQGILILTTPKGVMTDRDARAAGIGGEALCAVW